MWRDYNSVITDVKDIPLGTNGVDNSLHVTRP